MVFLNDYMSRKTIKLLSWFLIPIGIVLSCILSLWLTNFFFSAQFTFWKSLGFPSTGVVKIVDADRFNVWVETDNGQLFRSDIRCYKDKICKKWIEVKNVSKVGIDDFTSIIWGDNCEKLDLDEFPKNPTGIKTDCVLVIEPGPEYDFKTYYALMPDHSIKYWRYRSNYWNFVFFVALTFSFSLIIIYSFLYFRKRDILQENSG